VRLLTFILLLLPLQTCPATDLLADISARLVKNEITEGRFRQDKSIKVLKRPLISTGTFTYRRRQGVIWQTLTPVPSVLLVNQMRLLTTQGEQNLPPAFGRVLVAMFGGDLQLVNEDFAITGANDQGTWQLQLQPKDPLMQKIIIGMQLTGDKELKQLDIREASGNFTRITFEHITHPATLTPAQEADFERLSSPR
jgi:hypothetical protein